MPSFASQTPTFRKIYRAALNLPARIYRSVFTWRVLRRVLLGGAILATLIVSFYLEELWRGQRAWETARRAFEAQGGTLDPQKLIPPPVPDDQNFAMTPLLKPIFPQGSREHPNYYPGELSKRLVWPTADGQDPDADVPSDLVAWRVSKRIDLDAWRKFLGQPEILRALKKFDPVLSEISAASRRPFARFPIEYEKGYALLLLPHIGALLNLAKIYEVRALAELAAGQTDRAAEDTITIFQLANSTTDEPFLISQLTSVTIARLGTQVLWEGLVAHRWSDTQLAEFSNELQKFDYLAGELHSAQGELAGFDRLMQQTQDSPSRVPALFDLFADGHSPDRFGQGMLETLKLDVQRWLISRAQDWIPRGWLYQNRITSLRDWQNIISAFDLPRHRLDNEKINAIEAEITQRRRSLYNFFEPVMAWSGISRVFAAAQTELDEAQVACALERYRLANGQLPEMLDQLTPKFIAKLPTDVISGGPLHYQRKADGHFLLYEVGWNGTDDGGVIAKRGDDEIDPEKGDWVWPDAAQP
jgi:hypothetical protein